MSSVQIIKLSSSYARLAQGHARLLNHDQVTICDAINAIILLEVSYDSNPSFLPEINLLHTSFPTDPFEEYKNQAEYILTELGLVELWVGEQKRLDRAATSVRDKNKNSDLKNFLLTLFHHQNTNSWDGKITDPLFYCISVLTRNSHCGKMSKNNFSLLQDNLSILPKYVL